MLFGIIGYAVLFILMLVIARYIIKHETVHQPLDLVYGSSIGIFVGICLGAIALALWMKPADTVLIVGGWVFFGISCIFLLTALVLLVIGLKHKGAI